MTKPGGYVLVSVMSLVGTVFHYLPILLDLARRDGVPKQEQIVTTGLLPDEPDYGHLAMKCFRWSELESLLSQHGEIVAAAPPACCRTSSPRSPSCASSLRRWSSSSRASRVRCRAASTSSRSCGGRVERPWPST